MTNPTPHQCLALYSQGLTMKEVAKRLGTSTSTVFKRLKKAPTKDNYHIDLVRQTVLGLKKGEVCYCFNEEQLRDIKNGFEYFTVEIEQSVYVLTPIKIGYYKMRKWLKERKGKEDENK